MVFKDITPLLADHAGVRARSSRRCRRPAATRTAAVVDKVVGMEARGFILAAPVALALGAGFVPVRKAGKLPRETHAVSYALEYGEATLEMHRDALAPGDRVLLVDDVLATGGTVAATRRWSSACGAVAARRRRADGAGLPARPRGHRRPAPHHPDDRLSAAGEPAGPRHP